MITDQEALAAIDPDLPDDERAELATRLKASSAALDAYYDSRPQMEQLLAEVSGVKKVAPFGSAGESAAVAPAGASAGAIAEPAVADAEVVESADEKELKDLEARVAALQAKTKGE